MRRCTSSVKLAWCAPTPQRALCEMSGCGHRWPPPSGRINYTSESLSVSTAFDSAMSLGNVALRGARPSASGACTLWPAPACIPPAHIGDSQSSTLAVPLDFPALRRIAEKGCTL